MLYEIRYLAIFTALSFLAFSLLPYAVKVHYLQTYIGLAVVGDILAGILGGGLTTYMVIPKARTNK